ncbi:MAG: condensation domain-containing protein, partial [Granulosicoccaceae bacterium]
YGPTETTVTATVFVPPAGWDEENLPIGKAIKGYTAHILNEQRLPVAEGETGELYIGGHSLARGYLNRPEQTQEAFVTLEDEGGKLTRLYRTGDLARWLPSGDIAYAGRIDHQLKIGSYRVEPGEIEAALNQRPDVLESLVVADQSGHQKALLAYLACDLSEFDLSLTYSWLQEKLPPHMVPLKYVLLESFPKTINGKIDRKALPDASAAITATQTDYQAPQTDTERRLAAVWQSQLSLAQVGRSDDFFGLGGDSLLVARTLGAMQTQMGVAVSARDFFANPKLHQLARCIDSGQSEKEQLQLAPLATPLPETPLAASQLRLWLQYETTSRNLSQFHVHEAVSIRGALDLDKLEQSLRRVVDRHSALQMQVLTRDHGPVMRWTESFELPIQRHSSITESMDQFVERCVEEQRFDLAQGPLVRAHLARVADNEHLLIIVAHHLAVDGWSMSILLRELSAAYEARELPTNPKQFVEFAVADAKLRDNGHYDAQLDYWGEQLANLEPVEFSQDHRVPAVRQFSAQQIEFELSPAIVEQLEHRAKTLNSSVHALLMACYFALLQRHTRSNDIAIATAVHGRNSSELDNIVGTFISTLPIRTGVDSQQSFESLVKAVRDTTREAISNSDTQFDEIVKRVNPPRVSDQLPFSSFMFLLQNIPDGELKLDGLECEHIISPINTSEYHILLEINVVQRDEQPKYSARFVYSDELFHRNAIARFSTQYQRVLQQALSKPDLLLAEVELLSDTDKQHLINRLNPLSTAYDDSQSFIDRIWHQANLNPEKTAVCDDTGNSMSYRELALRAEKLAIHLQTLGAGPGVLIALSMHRSANMLVALLGILRSGSAYLPMDPSYPAERVRYILEDAKAPVLITEQVLANELPTSGAQVLRLDTDWPEILAAAASGVTLDADRQAQMHHLAYVIYTSGSTGNPKGVQLTHANLLASVRILDQVIDIPDGARVISWLPTAH